MNLSVKKLAERWGVSVSSIYTRLKDPEFCKKLGCFKVGEMYRIPLKFVIEYEKCGLNFTEENGAPTTHEVAVCPYVPPTVHLQSKG